MRGPVYTGSTNFSVSGNVPAYLLRETRTESGVILFGIGRHFNLPNVAGAAAGCGLRAQAVPMPVQDRFRGRPEFWLPYCATGSPNLAKSGVMPRPGAPVTKRHPWS